jgi:hypothetical protein
VLFAHQCWVECKSALVALACVQLVPCHLPVPVTQPLKGLSLLGPLLSRCFQQLSMTVLTLTAQLTTQRPVNPASVGWGMDGTRQGGKARASQGGREVRSEGAHQAARGESGCTTADNLLAKLLLFMGI